MDVDDIPIDSMWVGVRSWNEGVKIIVTAINYDTSTMQVLVDGRENTMWSLDLLMGYEQDKDYSFYRDVLRL